MPVLLRPRPDARASHSNERETQSLGKLRWWALPKGDRCAVSTLKCRRGGAPPPDKPGNDFQPARWFRHSTPALINPGLPSLFRRLIGRAPPVAPAAEAESIVDRRRQGGALGGQAVADGARQRSEAALNADPTRALGARRDRVAKAHVDAEARDVRSARS